MWPMSDDPAQNQLDKSKQAARELETDDEARFDEKMRKLMKQKPAEKPADEEAPSVNSVWDTVDKTDDEAVGAIG